MHMNDSAYCFPIVPQGTSGGGSASSVVIQELNVTENGTYSAPSGVDGFSPVTVNVASSGVGGGGGTSGENRLAMLLSDTLTEVTEEDFGSAKTIPNNTFYNKTNLVHVTIPNGITKIGSSAFSGCSSLASITIPDSVTSIGDNAFKQCGLSEITIPNSVTSIGSSAFVSCKNLKDATIPESVTNLGIQTFNGSGLISVKINSSVDISSQCFYTCTALEIADLNCKSIGSSAFAMCTKLSTLILRNDSVVSMTHAYAFNTTPFAGYNGLTGTAYVPQALIESYKTATNWSALYEAGTCNFVAIEGSEYE